MLIANPTVLRTLVERYETLRAEADRTEGGSTAGGATVLDARIEQQLQDTVYTLCVSTGTREIGAALTAARSQMEAAFAEDAGFGESAA